MSRRTSSLTPDPLAEMEHQKAELTHNLEALNVESDRIDQERRDLSKTTSGHEWRFYSNSCKTFHEGGPEALSAYVMSIIPEATHVKYAVAALDEQLKQSSAQQKHLRAAIKDINQSIKQSASNAENQGYLLQVVPGKSIEELKTIFRLTAEQAIDKHAGTFHVSKLATGYAKDVNVDAISTQLDALTEYLATKGVTAKLDQGTILITEDSGDEFRRKWQPPLY